MGEGGVMGVGGVMVNVGRGQPGCLVLVSATVEPGAGVEQGDEEGTMMRRSSCHGERGAISHVLLDTALGPRLFALRGSCDVLCTCSAVGEEDVYCEERCDKWCC